MLAEKCRRIAGKVSIAGSMVAITLLLGAKITEPAVAAENAFGTYILGQAGPQAGMMPPVSGVLSTYGLFIYSGKASPTKELPIDGNIAVDVEVTAVAGAPILMWVPDEAILGGRLGVYGLLPVGNVDFSGTITAPPLGSISQSRVSVGDPQVGALLGWNSGPWHWNVGTLVNVPIGDYELGRLDNLAFNHWSVDFHAGLTWMDPSTGLELSARAGITINDKNSATDYKTGEEFHLEFAALKHFSQQMNAGLVGYHYEQISGDSGSGAALGSFKGRVTGLGPHLSVTVPVGQTPVTFAGRGFVEFNAKNRLEGVSALLSATVPLYVSSPPPGAMPPQ